MTTRLLLCSIFGMAAIGGASADNWPQWRGPSGNGVVSGGDFPAEFSLEKNLEWSVDLPGKGSSTPVVWDGKCF